MKLPLVEGRLLVDNSFLETITMCWRAGQLNKIDSRVPSAEKASLNFGIVNHSALELRYRMCGSNPPTAEYEAALSTLLQTFFEEHPVDETEHRNLNHAREVLQRYNTKYRLEPFNVLVDKDGKPLVELSFALPLGKVQDVDIVFTGRIDLPVSWDNRLIIVDHKTDSMFYGPQWFLNEQSKSNQYLGYCFAFEELTGQHVDGFCVNGIPTKKPPEKPRTKTVDEWWSDQLVRDVQYLAIRPGWKDQWLRDTMTTVEVFLWHYARGYFPKNGMFVRSCSRYGGCCYADVCFAPSEEKAQEILQSNVFTDNKWTPLQEVKGKENV